MASQTHSTPSVRSLPGGHIQLAVETYRLGASSLPLSIEASSEAYTRLVVLVPGGMIDCGRLVQKLSGLITPSVSEMLFVGLGHRWTTSPAQRLVELASLAQELPIPQSQRIIDVSSWADAVQIVARPGDLIVCQADRGTDCLVEEISQVTASPVHFLTGLQPPLWIRLVHKLTRLMFNLFPFMVIAAFFCLQVQIDAQTTGLPHTLVIIATVVVELGVIFVWSLFIR
jgi:hypothetical protein